MQDNHDYSGFLLIFPIQCEHRTFAIISIVVSKWNALRSTLGFQNGHALRGKMIMIYDIVLIASIES